MPDPLALPTLVQLDTEAKAFSDCIDRNTQNLNQITAIVPVSSLQAAALAQLTTQLTAQIVRAQRGLTEIQKARAVALQA
jgi:primosomal protein N''